MRQKRPSVFYHLQGYDKEKEPIWKLVVERC